MSDAKPIPQAIVDHILGYFGPEGFRINSYPGGPEPRAYLEGVTMATEWFGTDDDMSQELFEACVEWGVEVVNKQATPEAVHFQYNDSVAWCGRPLVPHMFVAFISDLKGRRRCFSCEQALSKLDEPTSG